MTRPRPTRVDNDHEVVVDELEEDDDARRGLAANRGWWPPSFR